MRQEELRLAKFVPPNKVFIPRETLRRLYVDENLSMASIAKKLSTSRITIARLIKEEKLSRRIDFKC